MSDDKDWPRLMSVTPVVTVEGEERTRLRSGQTCMCVPAYVTDGDALGEDAVFLFAPAGHQPSEETVCIPAARLTELEAENAQLRRVIDNMANRPTEPKLLALSEQYGKALERIREFEEKT